MKETDYTYADTWIRRESNMIHNTYQEYLASDWWKKIKAKAQRRSRIYSRCNFCCSKENIDLHHTTYKHINTKHELCVIVALCRSCHKEVHETAKKLNISVQIATKVVRKKYSHYHV